MNDEKAQIRNAALEEAAQLCDKSSVQPAIAKMIRALADGSADVAPQPVRALVASGEIRKVLQDARWRIANLMPQPAQSIDKNVLVAIDQLLATPTTQQGGDHA